MTIKTTVNHCYNCDCPNNVLALLMGGGIAAVCSVQLEVPAPVSLLVPPLTPGEKINHMSGVAWGGMLTHFLLKFVVISRNSKHFLFFS